MSDYFRSLPGSHNPVEFAEDLGHAADRAQGGLNLVVDALAETAEEAMGLDYELSQLRAPNLCTRQKL
jgi:hypothetical protein